MSDIRVLPVQDGGNPRLGTDIQKTADGFFIRPFSEDGDGTYKFRLCVRVESDRAQSVHITVDWSELDHQNSRNLLYLTTGEGDDFQAFPTEIEDTLVRATLPIPAGVSYVSMLPRYEHGRMLALLQGLPKDIFDVYAYGKSRAGRDILVAEAGDRSLRPIAFYARVHPYESIGDFFIEGMLNLLTSGSAEAAEMLKNNHFMFIPMPNPDGVADGTHKLTHGGLNFSFNFTPSTEPEAAAMKAFFAEKRPEMLVDMHGWMLYLDNMVCNDNIRGRVAHAELMKDEELFCWPMEMIFRKMPRSGERHSCFYFAEALDCTFFNTSWTHRDRSADDMRRMGQSLLRAYVKANLAAAGKRTPVLS